MEDNSYSVKFDSESRQSLEKSNFDMKMKIYYLEEEIKKMKRNNLNGHSLGDIDNLQSEVENLRLQVHERSLELEQRKFVVLLVLF